MKKKRFSIEQIVAVLKPAEIAMSVAEVLRPVGVSEQMSYSPIPSRSDPGLHGSGE